MKSALIIIFVLLVIWNVHLYTQNPEAMVVSTIDGDEYAVKTNYADTQTAADILARLNIINTTLIDHLERKYNNTAYQSDIEFLSNNYDGDALSEHTPLTTVNTSYVLNKGDVIKLCLRNKKNGGFHDFNTLTFVNLHELSHLLDRKYGHNPSFWTGFKLILTEAHGLGLYTPVDYLKTPVTYCGMQITSNPYFDKY